MILRLLLFIALLKPVFSISETFEQNQAKLQRLIKRDNPAVLSTDAMSQSRLQRSMVGNSLKKEEDHMEYDNLTPEVAKAPAGLSLEHIFPPLQRILSREPGLIPAQMLDGVKPFGQDLFNFATNAVSTKSLQPRDVPDSYIVDQGDTLLIHVWNQTIDETFTAEVSQSGTIPFPLAGEIMVAGIEKKDLVSHLARNLSSYYKDVKLSVQMQGLRQIPVYVTGEVKQPGLYAVNALVTPLHLLMMSGGPTDRGSMRGLRLLQNGEVTQTLDLYDFINHGILKNASKLKASDVLHVPLMTARMAVIGRVKRPAVYELSQEASLQDVLALAGNLEPDADSKTIKWISYHNSGDLKMSDLSYAQLAKLKPEDGSILLVKTSQTQLIDKVSIAGNVYATGSYEYRKGMAVKDLVARAQGIKPETHMLNAEIRRLMASPQSIPHHHGVRLQTQYQTIHFDLQKELSGQSKTILLPRDEVRIFALRDVQLQPAVEVVGEVLSPGKLELQKGGRVRDVLLKARLKDGAHLLSGEISRQTTSGVQTLRFSVVDALSENQSENPELQHLDVITIFSDPRLANQGTISIRGEVLFPGSYRFNSGERLGDVIKRAGGFSKNAFLLGSRFYRLSVKKRQVEVRNTFVAREQESLNNLKLKVTQEDKENKEDTQSTLAALDQVDTTLDKLAKVEIEGRVALDFRDISDLSDLQNSSLNIVLEDGDRLEIPTKPSEITIAGQVYNPTTILYREGHSLMDYINAAGGMNDNAHRSRIFIIKANGQAMPAAALKSKRTSGRYVASSSALQPEHELYSNSIEPGDTVIVPTRIQIQRNQFRESLDSIYKMAVTVGALGNIF